VYIQLGKRVGARIWGEIETDTRRLESTFLDDAVMLPQAFLTIALDVYHLPVSFVRSL